MWLKLGTETRRLDCKLRHSRLGIPSKSGTLLNSFPWRSSRTRSGKGERVGRWGGWVGGRVGGWVGEGTRERRSGREMGKMRANSMGMTMIQSQKK